MPPKARPSKARGSTSTPNAKSSGGRSFSLLSFFSRAGSSSDISSRASGEPQRRTRDGAAIEDGSASDPVVISDDEGERPAKRVKRRSSSSSSGVEVVAMDEKGAEQGALTCPICGAALFAQDAETHVNACLDGGSKSNDSIKPAVARRLSTPKPSLPITSLARQLTTRDSSPSTRAPSSSLAPNAFSVLMDGHKEKEVWKEAEEAEARRDGSRRFGPRKAPFYKILTGMPIAVDAFCYGAIPRVTAYFLTHAHSDHYTNLSKSWRHGPIYCSHTTANLVVHMLGVDPQWVHGLPDNTPVVVPDSGGVTVTLIEANHCPGSSLFLFEGPQTVDAGGSTFRSPFVGSKRVFRYLHCGDFRACPKHVLHPAVAAAPLDTVYLDTTYLNPQYCFPPQPLVIEACAALAKRAALGDEIKTEPIAKQEQEEEDGLIPPDDENIDPDVGLDELEGEMVEEDIKPDVGSEEDASTEQDIKPSIETEAKPHIKPEVHPAEMAFALQERSAAMMEGWLVKKDPDGTSSAKAKGRTLVLVGTYTIGKERVVKAIAQALGSKIYCTARKRDVLNCEADPELHDMLGSDPTQCQVHIVPLNHISLEHMQPYLNTLKPHFQRILAFRPTGWTYRPPAGANTLPDVNFVIKRDQARGFTDVSLKPIRGSSRNIMMFGVPYSEHSSFFELTCFALSVGGAPKMIATVNVHNEKSRYKMQHWFDKWATERARRKERGQPAVVEYRDETYW